MSVYQIYSIGIGKMDTKSSTFSSDHIGEKHSRYLQGWTDDPLTCVKFEIIKGYIALITLSRPAKRNAWTEIMRNELSRCIERANLMKGKLLLQYVLHQYP